MRYKILRKDIFLIPSHAFPFCSYYYHILKWYQWKKNNFSKLKLDIDAKYLHIDIEKTITEDYLNQYFPKISLWIELNLEFKVLFPALIINIYPKVYSAIQRGFQSIFHYYIVILITTPVLCLLLIIW